MLRYTSRVGSLFCLLILFSSCKSSRLSQVVSQTMFSQLQRARHVPLYHLRSVVVTVAVSVTVTVSLLQFEPGGSIGTMVIPGLSGLDLLGTSPLLDGSLPEPSSVGFGAGVFTVVVRVVVVVSVDVVDADVSMSPPFDGDGRSPPLGR